MVSLLVFFFTAHGLQILKLSTVKALKLNISQINTNFPDPKILDMNMTLHTQESNAPSPEQEHLFIQIFVLLNKLLQSQYFSKNCTKFRHLNESHGFKSCVTLYRYIGYVSGQLK